MQQIHITLSVYHDGQFFTALFERTDACGYSAAKRIFAAKPSDLEILDFVCEDYYKLSFSMPAADERTQNGPIRNPKRRQREAARAMKTVRGATKAQAALSAEREMQKAQSKRKQRFDKEAAAKARFAQKAEKRRQKHRGH